jgi:hypothetical protein
MSNGYTVMYVDDDLTEVRQFKRHLSTYFEIETIDFNDITVDKIHSDLDDKNFDYLIVDYHLNDKTGCGFDGDVVLKDFLGKFPHFPAMLLTNQDEGAIESVKGLDVEKVRSKKEYLSDGLDKPFGARIRAKIDQYKQEIADAETKLAELVEKRAKGDSLSADEEDESIRLDDFLDDTLDAKAKSVPKEVISSTNDSRVGELLNKTDELIERLKKYENVS